MKKHSRKSVCRDEEDFGKAEKSPKKMKKAGFHGSETAQLSRRERLPENKITIEKARPKANTLKHKLNELSDEQSSSEGNDTMSESNDLEEEEIKLFTSKLKKTYSPPGNSDSDSSNHSSDYSSSESEERTIKKCEKRKGIDECKKTEDSDFSSDEEVSDQEHAVESVDQTQSDEYADIKKELAEMSFEQLQKLQDKMGLKSFNQLFHGKNKDTSDREKTGKKKFKRENKNRPMEMSSKRPVSVIRDRFPVKKEIHRDPRFDEFCGEYNETFFNEAYSFVYDIKAKEKKDIMKLVKKEKNTEKKEELRHLLKRMDQQELALKKKEQERTRSRELKKKERESVKEGKNPYFLKKSDKKKIELAEKFKELKKSGKLEKYLKKKRKKNATKERKKLPFLMQ